MFLRMVEIPPPGTWCQNQALREILRRCGGTRFLEVGCGGGQLAERLCTWGYEGLGIDYSPDALAIAEKRLKPHIEEGRYQLTLGDITQLTPSVPPLDLALSMMVMEHVEDDFGFLLKLIQYVRPNGHVIVGVPGRKDRWSYEDTVVGHLRRYDKAELQTLLQRAGLKDVEVWSVSVPVTNLLFRLGNFLVRRASSENHPPTSQRAQTETSGIRHVPFKTVFPAFFRLFLNSVTLYPLFLVQRLFYRTDLGLTLIAFGKVS